MTCILSRLWNTHAEVHAAAGPGETVLCPTFILKEAGNQVEIHRIQDALQSSETRITVQDLASLFRKTELRTHEYQFKCGYVVRQMLSSVIRHIVLYKIV